MGIYKNEAVPQGGRIGRLEKLAVKSDTTNISTATAVTNIVTMTSAQYVALNEYDAQTLYLIVG